MSDPFSQDYLTSPEVSAIADRLHANVVSDYGDAFGRAPVAAMLAFVRAFITICDGEDVDPSAAFEQIADAWMAGLIDPGPEDFDDDQMALAV